MASTTNLKYPIGLQSFEEIITGKYTYVDKTKFIHRLVDAGKYYFLSRPRRFGKSLLLSTIKAYFEGKKSLFEGLYIADKEQEWIQYPVIMLTLAGYNPSQDNLQEIISNQLSQYELLYGKRLETSDTGMRFRNVISSAYNATGRNVVILIDEYDSPMMSHLHEYEKYDEVRNLLKSVYVNLKDMDEYIRFAMLTGITRFSKMTIFSGLNNLDDISMDNEYGDICGLTENELSQYFRPGIEKLADNLGVDYTKAFAGLKENYDGYHFTKKPVDIFNPLSVLKCLSKSEYGSYWFQTGTPGFLVKELNNIKQSLPEIFNEEVSTATISDIDTYRSSPIALLFQTGYLTIKDYDPEYEMYRLGIPNREVEKGLFRELLSFNTESTRNDVDKLLVDIRRAFDNGLPDKALEKIRIFLASIPAYLSEKKPEIYFENNLYLLFKLVGMDVNVEWWSADGRIDLLLSTPKYIYVMELKLDKSAGQALAQIDSKDYTLQFRNAGRQIVKIGISFSSAQRNIGEYLINFE